MADARRVCPSCAAEYGKDVLFCPRDGAPLASRKPPSSGDPYQKLAVGQDLVIERLVGIGAMGRVYRAHQSGAERAVAVKILNREHVKNATLVSRFRREGRVAASLQHPNIVAVFSTGDLPPHGKQTDGEPYLVMEFLDGLSLRSALAASGGFLPLERALSITLGICDGMGEAHAHGIVHRDLKPENVMLVRCGADPDFVKVLDFGVARVGERDPSIATHAGAVLGSAAYACPESARGEPVGAPGDVYAIATVLFECLAGRTPFDGKSAVDVLIQHATADVPDVRSFPRAAQVPEPLAVVLRRNLDKNPFQRAPNARAFGRALVEASLTSRIDPARLTSRMTLLGSSADSPRSEIQVATSERKTLRNLGSRGGSLS